MDSDQQVAQSSQGEWFPNYPSAVGCQEITLLLNYYTALVWNTLKKKPDLTNRTGLAFIYGGILWNYSSTRGHKAVQPTLLVRSSLSLIHYFSALQSYEQFRGQMGGAHQCLPYTLATRWGLGSVALPCWWVPSPQLGLSGHVLLLLVCLWAWSVVQRECLWLERRCGDWTKLS